MISKESICVCVCVRNIYINNSRENEGTSYITFIVKYIRL